MWRIFKRSNPDKSISNNPTENKAIVDKIITKKESNKVPIDTEIKEILEKETLISKETTPQPEALDNRLKAIQDIVNKANQEYIVSPENTALNEDLTKFESFKKEENIEAVDTNLDEVVQERIKTTFKNEISSLDVKETIAEQMSENQIQEKIEKLSAEEIDVREVNNDKDIVTESIDNEIEILNENLHDEIVVDKKEENVLITRVNNSSIKLIFEYLEKNFKNKFLAGVIYDINTNEVLQKYEIQSDQHDMFTFLFKEINAAVVKSGFPKLSSYYVLDLQYENIVFVLTYPKHHFVLVFDKSKIRLGYILSIIKPYIDKKYFNAIEEK